MKNMLRYGEKRTYAMGGFHEKLYRFVVPEHSRRDLENTCPAAMAALWFMGDAGTEGFILVFALAILALARWRFPFLHGQHWSTSSYAYPSFHSGRRPASDWLCRYLKPCLPVHRYFPCPSWQCLSSAMSIRTSRFCSCSFKLHLRDGSFYVGPNKPISIDWRRIRSVAIATNWKY